MGYERVEAVTSRLFHEGRLIEFGGGQTGTVEDFAHASWVADAGAAIRLACSWRLSAGCDAVIEAGFYGTRGAVRLRNLDGSFYRFLVERMNGTTCQPIATPPEDWGGRCLADWCQRLARSPQYDPDLETVAGVAEVLDRCYGRA